MGAFIRSTLAMMLTALWMMLSSSSTMAFSPRLQHSSAKFASPRVLNPRSTSYTRQYLSQEQEAWAASDASKPLAIGTGHSSNPSLLEALHEAVTMALQSLPPSTEDQPLTVDLATVFVSSLYDGGPQQPATLTVPTILASAASYNVQIENIVGGSVAGCIASTPTARLSEDELDDDDDDEEDKIVTACQPVEYESIPAITVTMNVFPDTTVQTFHVDELPEDVGRMSALQWKQEVGLLPRQAVKDDSLSAPPTSFLLLPSPAYSTEVDALLFGIDTYFPGSTTVGGIVSTVSSLSRAKLYQWSAQSSDPNSACHTEGCVGVLLQGDVQFQKLMAQGAKPVGGVYQILKGSDSTINAIVLDEAATEALKDSEQDDEEEEEEEEEEEDDETMDVKARQAQAYAKARIPKPILAEANFLMRTLSDDDQAFMRRTLLVGLEQQQGGAMTARTVSELMRLAEGQGHRFTVHQVASAGMKDGSVTLPLGKVTVSPGTRMRFFVRESTFAKKEVEALWLGYKKRLLKEQFEDVQSQKFEPAACMVIPTLDRGSKFFQGQQFYESSTATRMLPGVRCINGFYSNGVLLSGQTVQGSATGYFLIGSHSGRPIYDPETDRAAEEVAEDGSADEGPAVRMGPQELTQKAPRDDNGELILKRREVHSGRAMTVSTVEWSVAEKTAVPTSALEEYMWDKETEVDRFRERVPLANLVSQCRLSAVDPTVPKPRDFVGSLNNSGRDFWLIPELKKSDPSSGSLRKRYDVSKLTRALTQGDAPALAVNCDPIFFGGSLDDITTVRTESCKAALDALSDENDGVIVPPILALDLILYPYQLYKLRLAGADAVTLVAGALAAKDLLYLSKIASSLQLQVFCQVTSAVQLQALLPLTQGSVQGVILSNRELEDYSHDLTGNQALDLLQSEALQQVKAHHGENMPVLVQGRVGLIGEPPQEYVQQLKNAGASGVIVGGGLAEKDPVAAMEKLHTV